MTNIDTLNMLDKLNAINRVSDAIFTLGNHLSHADCLTEEIREQNKHKWDLLEEVVVDAIGKLKEIIKEI